MSLLSWKLHGDGKSISSGDVVSTDERLTWPRTVGVGLQHIAAMFGATFLVPIITGFPPTTTLFFSGIGTLLFLVITKNRVPSYLGSSFAFLAPIAGAMGADKNFGAALGGVVVTGVILALVGLIACGCTENQRAKNFGGTATIKLPTNSKLVTVSWEQDHLWYLTRPARNGETPETFTFQEKSGLGIFDGQVILIEH